MQHFSRLHVQCNLNPVRFVTFIFLAFLSSLSCYQKKKYVIVWLELQLHVTFLFLGSLLQGEYMLIHKSNDCIFLLHLFSLLLLRHWKIINEYKLFPSFICFIQTVLLPIFCRKYHGKILHQYNITSRSKLHR